LPEVIRLAELIYVCFPLSWSKFEDLLFERGIDICRERCSTGETGLARCVPPTFTSSAPAAYAAEAVQIGFRHVVTVRWSTFGVRLITSCNDGELRDQNPRQRCTSDITEQGKD